MKIPAVSRGHKVPEGLKNEKYKVMKQ